MGKKRVLIKRVLPIMLIFSTMLLMCACGKTSNDENQSQTQSITEHTDETSSAQDSEEETDSMQESTVQSNNSRVTSSKSEKTSSSPSSSKKSGDTNSANSSKKSTDTDSANSSKKSTNTNSAESSKKIITSESAVSTKSNTESKSDTVSSSSENTQTVTSENKNTEQSVTSQTSETNEENNDEQTDSSEVSNESENTVSSETVTENYSMPEVVSRPTERTSDKKIVVIDAGHQEHANFEYEPMGPGSSEMKIKVSGGTSGVVTGIPEYELTLILALKLQTILEERGYEVVQTRTTHDVDIGNIDRANVANSINADAFIRIHANGSDSSYVNGAMTLCQTPYNPYNGNIYDECKALSTYVLDELVSATGCNKQYVWETDTMCGINWSQVPVTIVEVGYMSNPQEDRLMATEEYQDKICEGLANGLEKFLETQ